MIRTIFTPFFFFDKMKFEETKLLIYKFKNKKNNWKMIRTIFTPFFFWQNEIWRNKIAHI